MEIRRYSLRDRALGYFALFLLGLIGLTCDQLHRIKFRRPQLELGRIRTLL
jgi:hypothetical protein